MPNHPADVLKHVRALAAAAARPIQEAKRLAEASPEAPEQVERQQ